MAATIRGTVFDDLNNNGLLDPGEPGIPGVYVVLRDPNGVCTTVQTDASGVYTFSNLTVAGNYTVYETAVDPGATCPPTTFGQPAGFTNSSTFRTQTINVTQTQINNDAIINGRNYGHDNPQTFTCIAVGYQVAIPGPGINSQFLRINLVTGNTTVIDPDMGLQINAIGYNVLDDMIYGIEDGTNNLIRVAQDGSITNFGPITGLPTGIDYTVGDIDNQGHMYIYRNATGTFYEVDVDQNSPTFGQVLNTVPIASTPIADWSWNPIDGQLYGITNTGTVVRIDPTNGNITNLTTVGLPGGSFYGATFIDAAGTLYAINNNTGVVYRITISGNNATGEEFSQAVSTSGNDGAACANALLEIDFGDAPDPTPGTGPDDYNTLLVNNGPRHQIINQLTLGTQVTAEMDAYANLTTDATGDDIPQGIQDDGVTLPLTPLLVTDTTYSLTVDVVNNTGLPANVYGWIDFNKNGVFQGNEAAPVVVVPSAPGIQQVVLNFTVPVGVTLTPDHTFVRVRLTTDELINQNTSPTAEDTRSIGPASDGEVEDYYLAIEPQADISVVKTVNPDPVTAGQQATYTMLVSNAGPSDALNVILTDIVPACILNPEYSLDGGLTWAAWPGSVNLGTIVAGGSVTVLIRGTVDPSCTGTITNTATVSSDVLDPDPTNNTSTVVTQVETSADVSVVKTASPDPVVAGEQIQYTINVANAGSSDAQNVSLADAVPAEILNAEFSIDGGITWNPWVSPYSIGTLAVGASVTVLIRGTVDPTYTGGSTSNTATVSSTTPDPDPTNNTSTVVTQVETSADVSVVKTASPDPVVAGEQIQYTINVANAGSSDAQNVSLADAVPAEILNAEFSIDGGVTWNPWVSPYSIGTLAVGSSVTVLIRGTVDPTYTGGSTSNTATVSSTTPDPDPTNNTSTVVTPVETSADVSVVKTASPDPVVAGEQIQYTINVANAGPSDAENVSLQDVVPVEVLNPEFSLDGGVTWNPWVSPYNIGTLAVGSSVTVLIRGTVDPTYTGGSTSNTATVSSTTPDPDPTNNTSTVVTQVETSADISVVKTVNPDPVTAGQQATYTMLVSNAGPSDALNVMLTDVVPACLLNPEYSLDGGLTWAAWPGSVNLGTIASGGSVTVLIRGTVDPSCTGTITNTATVDSDTPDPDPTNNSSTTDTPINTSADISVVKTINPSPVVAGEQATYTMLVSNAGPSDALNVILTDVVPVCLLNPEYSLDGGLTWNAWTGSVNLGTIAAGGSVTVLIRGTVDSSCTGTITNTATVSSTTPDPDPTNNSSTTNTPVNTSADISVVKTVNPNPVTAGQQATYTMLVSNAGPSDALNVILTDVVPACLLNTEYSLDGGLTWAAWPGSVNLGTIASGGSVTVLIRGTVDPACTGTITNTATVDSDTPDPDPTNNSSTIDTPVNTSADISVVKTVNPNPVTAGQQATYTMLVSNAGPSDALNVILTDVVPACILNSEYSLDGGITWAAWPGSVNLGTIASGGSVTVLIRGTVNPSCTGTVTNTATVDSDTPDPDPTNNSSTIDTPVNTSADISVVKTVNPDPVTAGQQATYTMLVSNTGPSDALNVILTDVVPACILNPEYSLDGGLTWAAWTGSVNLGTIASGGSVTVLIRGTVDPSCIGTITNTATVNSPTPDPDPTNNTSTIDTPINTSADISVVKTVNPSPVVAGEEATYTMVVSNTGPSDALNVILTDAVPACILNPEYSLDGGLTWAAWTGSVNLGTIASGGSVTVLIRGTVDPSCTGTITNTATVSSDTPDPDPTNNTSTIDTPINTSADISVVKTVNPSPVVAGQQATYTMVVKNAGPSDALNVILTDAVPACILNSEYSLDGGLTWAAWPGSVNLGTIAAGGSVIVLIRGTVDPSCIGTITNTARVDSTTPDPDPTNNETTIVTPIDTSADLSITKTVNPDPVVAGEQATYTITACNAGPSDAQNVILTDAVSACLLNPEYSLDGGITWAAWTGSVNLGTIGAGQCVTVLIRGTVDSSCIGTITNTARVDSTTPDSDPTNNETTIETPIDTSADLSITKTVNPDPVVAGEQATYTITACNAGPSDAQNVILTDAVSACLLNPEYSLDGGITWAAWTGSVNLGTIGAGQCVTVLIRGTVDSSCIGTITNTARVDSTTPDPDPTNNETTIVTEIDTSADISVVKTANANNFTTGDVVTYTIAVKNAGPSDAQNVILTDVVPTQILNPEFSKDGGAHWNPWVSPYNIGTVAAGATVNILIRGTVSETAIGTVRNTAKVDSETEDPNPTNNSSTLDVEVKIAKLQVVKSADKTAVKVGDTLTYTVAIKNTGNTAANNVVFKDQIPVGTSFVAGSVSINGTPNVGANPETGFDIGTIATGETVLVSFTVKVESRPTPPEAVNTAVVDFNFIVDPSRPAIEKSTTSNEVKTEIEIIKVDVVKSADTTFAVKGDTITYTVIVTNSSTIPVNNVIFKDPIPNGTSFVPGSVTINGNAASGNPSTGINLGTLAPNQSVSISFKVKIDFVPCPPRIINKALVNFEYTLGNKLIKESVESNSAITDVGPSSFKQLSREEYVRIPAQKPDAEDILNTVVDIEITDTKVIRTPMIASLEGQSLTGFKLIVEGILNQKVEYIACDKEQSVHAAHFRVPFSTFIILPEDYEEGTPVEVDATVEDIYTKLLDKRTIFKNITFMLIAR